MKKKILLCLVAIIATFCFVSCNLNVSKEPEKPKVQVIDGLWVFEKKRG